MNEIAKPTAANMAVNDIAAAAMFWAKGFGTDDIARFLGVSEATIYNSLTELRALARVEPRR